MKKTFIFVFALLPLAMLALAGWGLFQKNPEFKRQILGAMNLQGTERAFFLEASGTIEAEEVSIVAEIGGRVSKIHADEGDSVQEGKILIQLDTALMEAQMEEAKAAVRTARANLEQAQAGPRPEEVALVQAALSRARAEAEGAFSAWQNTLDVLKNPLELNAQIEEARTQVELAEQQVAQAEAALNRARAEQERYRFNSSEEGKTAFAAYSAQVRGAEAALAAARAAHEGAKQNLADLIEMKENPLSLEAQVSAARARYEAACKGVEVAQAELEKVLAGPRKEDVDVARAELHQAEAVLGLLETQLEKMALRSPITGMVTGRIVNEGEMASPGNALLTVANLDEVTLTVYIPEEEIGLVKLGQKVEVQADSFPGRVFYGHIKYISGEAEFTPKNVQTKKERVNMVFAVKVKIPNHEGALKPGMPADAKIIIEEIEGMELAQKAGGEEAALGIPPGLRNRPTLQGSPTPKIASPTPTSTPIPQPLTSNLQPPASNLQAEVLSLGLNVRAGPGLSYPVLDSLARGDVVQVTGLDPARGWLQIIYPSSPDGLGWISGKPKYVRLLAGAPSRSPASPAPLPTPAPASKAEEAPTLEGRILFPVLNRSYRPRPLYDLYVANVDGSERRLVEAGMRQPDARRDMLIIANGEGLPNQESLFAINLDTGEKREASINANDFRPCFSPDGGRVLYSNLQRNELVVQDGAFRDAARHILRYDITTLVGRHPAWVDDGRIVYNGCDVWFSDGGCGLYLTDITGQTRPQRLTAEPDDIAPAAYGERIAFMSRRDGNWELYIINTDGTGLRRLTEDPADDGLPAWSPDGKEIAFLSNRDGGWAIWALSPEGGPFVSGTNGPTWKLFELDGEMGQDWPDERLAWLPPRGERDESLSAKRK